MLDSKGLPTADLKRGFLFGTGAPAAAGIGYGIYAGRSVLLLLFLSVIGAEAIAPVVEVLRRRGVTLVAAVLFLLLDTAESRGDADDQRVAADDRRNGSPPPRAAEDFDLNRRNANSARPAERGICGCYPFVACPPEMTQRMTGSV